MTAAPGTLLRRPAAPAADGAIHRIAPPDAGFAWTSFAVHRLEPGQEVLMMEDVVTTGLSSREAIAAIEAAGGRVIAMASLVDRSGGKAAFDVPFFPLIRLDVPTYQPDALPPELAAIPAIKPGSRAA